MRALIAIQDGQISVEQIKKLEQIVRALYAEHVDARKLTLIWNVADRQHTITNRKWSHSSAFSIGVPDGFPGNKREAFLMALDQNWRAVTGQHPDQTSFAAMDETRFREVMKGNLERFSRLGRILYLFRTSRRMTKSKREHGVLISRFNQ